jgi:hypothetical protein
MAITVSQAIFSALVVWLGRAVAGGLYNMFLHPLSKYPGPAAAKATTWWKTYVEVVRQESMVDVLFELHKEFGA